MSEAQVEDAPNIRTLLTTPKIVIEDTSGGDAPMDKYTAGIELSNACRQFYVTRLKAAGKVKERLGLSNGFSSNHDCIEDAGAETKHTCAAVGRDVPLPAPHKSQETKRRPAKPRSEIENKMAVLKSEMASLIDQDLALMKQLLTLNEQIEELKWQRKLRGYQAGSGSVTSSCNIDSNVSVATLSDGEWDSRLDHRECPGKYPTPSSLSLYSDYGTSPRASVDKELSRSNAAGPGPSKLVQDNTHKLLGGESTSDLGSSDELTSSNSELPEYNTARTTNTRIVQQSIRPEKHVQDQQKKQHTSRFLKVKTLELAL